MAGTGIPSGVPGTVPCVDNRVIIVNQAGEITWQYGGALDIIAFASRLPNGDTLITDTANQRIVEINAQNQTVWRFYTNETEGSVSQPHPSNAVRLSNGDTNNDRIIVVNTQGQTLY